MVEETTLIRVTISTKKKLDDLGKKTDSYNDIIKRMMDGHH
jgi:hypothetical protein